MSNKTKSFLYFASFIIAAATYNNMESKIIKNSELAGQSIELVSNSDVLK